MTNDQYQDEVEGRVGDELRVVEDEAKKAAAKFYREAIVKLYGVIGANEGECKSCGRRIWWVSTRNNASAPYTVDGVSHFSDCPKADRHRR